MASAFSLWFANFQASCDRARKKALQMFIKSLQMGYIKGAIEAYEEWIEIIQDEL